jgi:hypothetical protein
MGRPRAYRALATRYAECRRGETNSTVVVRIALAVRLAKIQIGCD